MPLYKPTEVSNRSADLFDRSAAFCCRLRTPTHPFVKSETPRNCGPHGRGVSWPRVLFRSRQALGERVIQQPLHFLRGIFRQAFLLFT